MRSKRIKENKDYKIRYAYYNSEAKFVVLRSVLKNQRLPSVFRIYARYKVFKLTQAYHFPSNYLNRCLITGRVRATLPYFKLSRIEFRAMARKNYFLGVRKSSW